MGPTRRRLLILVAAAFVAGLVAFLPAKLIEARINEAFAPACHLSVSGSVWTGFGELQCGPSSDAFTVPVAWRVDPLALARLRVAWDVVTASPLLSGSAKVGAGLRSVEFRDVSLNIDAAAIQLAMPVVAIFAPSGIFGISTPDDARLTIGYGNEFRINGDGHIKVDNFGLRPYGPQPLGSYQLKFTGRDTTIDYAISQSSGALKLDGGGSIQSAAPRQISYAGYITPSPALADNLLSQLKAIGQPSADGRLRVDWKSPW